MVEAAAWLSRLRALVVARERFLEVGFRLPCWARSASRSAFCRVCWETVPLLGSGSFTPARRALESPIAIACLVERAPCLPWRICSISSRTNSPAWVEGALPSASSWRARSIVFFSGITIEFARAGRDGCTGQLKLRIGGLKLRPIFTCVSSSK